MHRSSSHLSHTGTRTDGAKGEGGRPAEAGLPTSLLQPSCHGLLGPQQGQVQADASCQRPEGLSGLQWWLVWCGVVWCGVVWCGVVWCGEVLCGVVWCGVVLCSCE